MAYLLDIKNKNEFSFDTQKNLISNEIIKSIIKNINTSKEKINILIVKINEDKIVYNLSIQRKHFKDILLKNLKYKEKIEDYTMCIKIRDAIKNLN